MKQNEQTLRFCQALLTYGFNRCRAMANFVMSLASSPLINHPVELAASPFCHYHYSNLTKVLQHWQVTESDFRVFIRNFLPAPRVLASGLRYYAFSHDLTKLLKGHSPCLKDRQYVQVSNNLIPSNRPIGVGYPVSVLHLGEEVGWSPPLALQRLEPTDDANAVAVKQIKSLLTDETLPFGQELCLLRADSGYGKAIFLSPLYDLEHLTLVVRLRSGMKVWTQAPDAEPTGGARRIYGNKFYLNDASGSKTYHKKGIPYQVQQESLCEQTPDVHIEKEILLGNGRKAILDIRRWNNLLIRTKKGASMKDKPIDVLRVRILDAQSRQPIFDRPMFVAVSGKRKDELDTAAAQEQYRERYDVEPFYRFAKNQLLMDKLQTPDVKHLTNWLRIVQITTWLLFTARKEIGQLDCPVWQQYLPKNKVAKENPKLPLTIAQTQRSAHLLFSTFDSTPFLPLKCKKGKGRKKGYTLTRRTRFKVVKKNGKSLRKLKNQQNE